MRWTHYILFVVFISLGCLGCERSTDWDIQSVDEIRLVVEAILTDKNEIQNIQLSESYSELNTTPLAIIDAEIAVRVNTTTYIFLPDLAQPGRYRSQIPFGVFSGLPYFLTIRWQGKEYKSTAQLAPVTVIPAVSFIPYNNTDSVEIDDTSIPLFSPSQQSMYQFDVDWSHISTEGPSKIRFYKYTFDKIHSSQFLRPKAAPAPMPKGAVVSITKYGLSDEFADFLRAQVIETDWNGAVFYANAENGHTNISNGALGYFATCAVLQDNLIAQ